MKSKKSVYDIVYDDLENYSIEDKNRLINIFRNNTHRYDWIQYMIQKLKSSLNIFKIIDVLKICVSIDLDFTREYIEKEKLSFYYQYFLISAILDIHQPTTNKDYLMNHMIRIKESVITERKDSLLK
jgi:hypothetical protein